MRGAKSERAIETATRRDGGFVHGEHVVVACSGGPDSVALAGILAAIAPRLELHVTLAHVNHAVRPSARQDEAVVLAAGAAVGIPVKVAALTGVRKDEASLRESRYEALLEVARGAGAGVVATAHTAEDQTETVLLALFRGTGPEGLSGIAARRPLGVGVDLVRPLLRWDHQALASYCHLLALPYAIDPSNADLEYRRNAVRAALEALRPSFPGLDQAVARTAELVGAEQAGEDRAALRQRVREVLGESDALRNVDFEHVEAAVRALEAGGSGRFFMNSEVELTIHGGEITVRKSP
ncbi:MAG: tRNA lysidine(34) synthetase TilS [Candidatus Eremiobacteraeota bacterium]|nr:tRNA lysidine(34) synthetase TilS [Candidatus Eremiobacteraeota bacterium]